MDIFSKWSNVLTNPVKAFKKEKKKDVSLAEGAKHILISGILSGFIAGLITGLYSALFTSYTTIFGGVFGGLLSFVIILIATPILFLISWIIGSGILYVISLFLGGKGNFTTQSYYIALFLAPIALLSSVIGMIPLVGPFINIFIGLYCLYLLTISLKETHKFSTLKAIAVWMIPIIIVSVILVVMAIAFVAILLAALKSMYGSGLY